MWPIDPLHSCGTLASRLLNDISVIVRKLFASSRTMTLDALEVVWNQEVATRSERVRQDAGCVFAGNIEVSTADKVRRGQLVTISRVKSVCNGTAVLLHSVLQCKATHSGAPMCSALCHTLHNVASRNVRAAAAKACQNASAIICMCSEQVQFNWEGPAAAARFHDAAVALMTAWIKLDEYALRLNLDPNDLTSRGGRGSLRTVHALLMHTPYLRREFGRYKSCSVFEMWHAMTKRNLEAVQIVTDDSLLSSRLLTQALSFALTAIATDARYSAFRGPDASSRSAPSIEWSAMRFARAPEEVQAGATVTTHEVWKLVLEDMAHKVKEGLHVSAEDAADLGRSMLEHGHDCAQEGQESFEDIVSRCMESTEAFCCVGWSPRYSLHDDGGNCAKTARGKPAPPLPWLSEVKSGQFVVYRMAQGPVGVVHAARALAWVNCVYRIRDGGDIGAQCNVILEFFEPEAPSRSDRSTIFTRMPVPGSRGSRGSGRRWLSIMPRASVWERLPLTSIDTQESRFVLPMFFQCVLNSCAEVDCLKFE